VAQIVLCAHNIVLVLGIECASVLQDVGFYALILQFYKAVAFAMPKIMRSVVARVLPLATCSYLMMVYYV